MSLNDFINNNSAIFFSRQGCGAPYHINTASPFVIFIVNKDYPSLSACLWNKVLGTKNSAFLVVENKALMPKLLQILKQEKNLQGGGFGVGFKDFVIQQNLIIADKFTRILGAANVFRKHGNRLIGINTDGEGFVTPLLSLIQEKNINLTGKKIILLGAGGTARAIAFSLAKYLLKRNVSLIITNRTFVKAEILKQDLLKYFGKSKKDLIQLRKRGELKQTLNENNLLAIINTIDSKNVDALNFSPLAEFDLSQKDNQKKSLEILKLAKENNPHLIVADILLRKKTTLILKQAKKLGLTIMDGRPMVLHQAVAAIKFVYPNLNQSDKQILAVMEKII